MDTMTATPDAGASDVAPVTAEAAPDKLPPSGSPGSPQDKPQEALSTDDAIAKAMADTKPKAERGEDGKFAGKEPKPEAKAEPKAEAPKVEAPKAEAPKEAEPAPKPRVEAPARFNDLAKTDWANVPEQVQSEVVRMQRELENGISEYKARVEPIKPFMDMAEKAGVKFEDALQNYVAAEQALVSNPMQALAQMAQQYVPGGLQAFVAQLTGQQAQNDPRDAQIAQLQQQIAQLSQGFQQTTQTLEQQRAAQAQAERQAVVDQFVAAHPRAQEPEIEAEMTHLLSSGYIPADLPPQDRLSQAYDTATRLIPAPVQEPAPPQAPAPQTRPEPTSLTGAPSGGSYPRPDEVLSTEEAIQRAYRRR